MDQAAPETVQSIDPDQNIMAGWLRELADDVQAGNVRAIAVTSIYEPAVAVDRGGEASTTMQMAKDRYDEMCLIGELEHCKARLMGLVNLVDLEDLEEP